MNCSSHWPSPREYKSNSLPGWYCACWSFHCSSSHFSRVGCKNCEKTSLQVRNSVSIGHINTHCELLNMNMLCICLKHAPNSFFLRSGKHIRAMCQATSEPLGQLTHQFFTTGGSPWLRTNCLLVQKNILGQIYFKTIPVKIYIGTQNSGSSHEKYIGTSFYRQRMMSLNMLSLIGQTIFS